MALWGEKVVRKFPLLDHGFITKSPYRISRSVKYCVLLYITGDCLRGSGDKVHRTDTASRTEAILAAGLRLLVPNQEGPRR